MTGEQNVPMRVEDEIDAALKMLGETRPPAEIVSRVHHRLEAAIISQPSKSSRRFLIPAAGVAMAAVILAAIFIPMYRAQVNRASAIETARVVANTPLAQGDDDASIRDGRGSEISGREATRAVLHATTKSTQSRNSARQ